MQYGRHGKHSTHMVQILLLAFLSSPMSSDIYRTIERFMQFLLRYREMLLPHIAALLVSAQCRYRKELPPYFYHIVSR